jgi:hypothetical protein
MGNLIIKAASALCESFECKSNCSIHHELDENIKENKICFNSLKMSQTDIKKLNQIIKKYDSVSLKPEKTTYNYITEV